jgi:hypothetical protein
MTARGSIGVVGTHASRIPAGISTTPTGGWASTGARGVDNPTGLVRLVVFGRLVPAAFNSVPRSRSAARATTSSSVILPSRWPSVNANPELVGARDLRERKSLTCEHVHRLRGHLELR